MSDGRSHAVVLAAGMGTRLRPVTESTPKTLLEVGDHSILERIFGALDQTGYETVTTVTGFEADQIREFCEDADRLDLEFDFVHSDAYESTNNLYSLWLARDRLDGGFTLVNSDTLFPAASLRRLAETDGSALLVDTEKTLGDEEMKVRAEGGDAVDIGKDLQEATGEYIGVSKFGPAGADALVGELDALVDAGRTNEWYEAAFDRVFDDVDATIVEVDDNWIEIDDHDDLRTGRRLFGEVTAE